MEKALNATFSLGSLSVARFVVNGLRENTYIIYNKAGEGFVVDCGARTPAECNAIATFVADHKIALHSHILTHCHFDHLWGAQWLSDLYGLTPTIPPAERNNYDCAQAVATKVYHRNQTLPLPPHPLSLGSEACGLRIISTPGHTKGSVCFYSEADGFLLSGDSLFKGYIGLPKEADIEDGTMLRSLQTHIYTLPKDTLVLPGHGPEFRL